MAKVGAFREHVAELAFAYIAIDKIVFAAPPTPNPTRRKAHDERSGTGRPAGPRRHALGILHSCAYPLTLYRPLVIMRT